MIMTVSVFMYILIEVVACYYQDMPVDSYTLYDTFGNPINTRYEERIKQTWAFTHTPYEGTIIELGCGSGLSSVNINKRLCGKDIHKIVVTPDKVDHMKSIKEKTKCTFDIIDENKFSCGEAMDVCNALIIHYDGQMLFHAFILANPNVLASPSVIILEADPCRKIFSSLLKSYGFEQYKKYIFLSVWYNKNKVTFTQ